MIRKTLTAAMLVAATATLAACGDNGMSGMDHSASSTPDSTTGSAPAGVNNADISFVSGMIPHHRQAIEMAKLAPSRSTDPAVKKLARKIQGAQDPEIEKMTGWLQAWGEPVPAEMEGHSMGGDGMMTMDEMGELEAATGAEFDRLFLTLMIKHHQGAIEMSQTEQQDGSDAAAKQLAGEIITAQTDEIALMEKMLA